MKNIKYTVCREGKYYVSKCLNVEVSSFGDTIDEAVKNLMEALELYFEDNPDYDFTEIDIALLGEQSLNA